MNESEHARMHAEGIPHEHNYIHKDKQAVINRLSKAIGHLESVKKMVENDRDYTEVLTQLTAVRAAITNTGKIILQDHMEDCMQDAFEHGDKQALANLEDAINRFIK